VRYDVPGSALLCVVVRYYVPGSALFLRYDVGVCERDGVRFSMWVGMECGVYVCVHVCVCVCLCMLVCVCTRGPGPSWWHKNKQRVCQWFESESVPGSALLCVMMWECVSGTACGLACG
jgi:hypothetical protein